MTSACNKRATNVHRQINTRILRRDREVRLAEYLRYRQIILASFPQIFSPVTFFLSASSCIIFRATFTVLCSTNGSRRYEFCQDQISASLQRCTGNPTWVRVYGRARECTLKYSDRCQHKTWTNFNQGGLGRPVRL